VTTDGAIRLLAEPRKMQRRQAVAALREFGSNPVSGKTITLRQGRFGLYVTDGETNASLRSGDVAEEMTPERAQELLQLRRDAGGSGGKKVAKKAYGKKFAPKASGTEAGGGAAKKATAKKATATKKAAKKATTKKASSKKAAKKASD
jgi:DNA topoisomerase-1